MLNDCRNLPDEIRTRLAEGFGEHVLDERHRGFDLDYKGETLEYRVCRRVQTRTAQDGAPTIVGYATVYDTPYDVMGGPPYGWSEVIARGAADKSVAERDDVYLFFDHDGLPMAATKARTLSLDSDRMGLFSEARVDPNDPLSMAVVRRLERGELDAMSFAFKVTRQRWENEDGNTADPKSAPVRRIQEVKLYDVSVVSFPANPATAVQMQTNRDGMSVAEARAALSALRTA
jgi:HK97 family phage prohead protease